MDANPGRVPNNIWVDIPPINSQANERIGYPTQKPLALLERIIKASSNEGDIVLDPFCGCATACVAADKLGRKWVGIDISPKAVELVNMRLQQTMGSLFHHGYVTARTDHLDNLQLLCSSCNRIKGDRPHEYLVARLAEIGV